MITRWLGLSAAIFLLVFNANSIYGQDVTIKDLMHVSNLINPESLDSFSQASSDSAKVDALMDIAYQLEIASPDSALWIYEETEKLASNTGYAGAASRCIQYSGIVESDRGNYNEAFELYDRAIDMFLANADSVGYASCQVNKGVIHNYLGEFDQASEKYIEAIHIYEAAGDTRRLSYVLGNYAGVLMEIGEPERSLPYFRRSYGIAKNAESNQEMNAALLNMGHAFGRMQNMDSSFHYYRILEPKAIAENDIIHLYFVNLNLAQNFYEMNVGDSALKRAAKSVEYAKRLQNPFQHVNATKSYGCRQLEFGNPDSAIVMLEGAVEMGQKYGMKDAMVEALICLSEAYAETGEMEKAFQTRVLQGVYADSVLTEEKNQALGKLEIRYQTALKDAQIAEQDLTLQQKQLDIDEEVRKRNSALIGIGILAVFAVLLVVLYRQRTRLHAEAMAKAKKEQELASYKAMSLGEEKERSRIARELHDGISGMLAALKMKFSSTISDPESKDNRDYVGALDEVSSEIRRISHDLMPGSLQRYGLVEALSSWFSDINSAKKLEIFFDHFGMEKRLEPQFERMLYRIIQELINNTIKHANAKEAHVQLTRNENLLTVTVEDDGVGFDPNKSSDGIGMQNLKSRIDAINGGLDIQSDPKNGTSVYIEVVMREGT